MSAAAKLAIAISMGCTIGCARSEPAQAAQTQTPTQLQARSSEAADVAAPGERRPAAANQRSTPTARDACALLSSAEITEVTGLAIERMERKPNGCDWYANAAARQQKGADSVADTFAKLTKEEPKTQADAAHSMETMLKGLTSAAGGADKPLFAITVDWENADQAEASIKTSVGVAGGGLPGGRLEPIEGLGDRAYAGPAGAFYCVRKGSAFVTFGLSTGTREQAIALARKIVDRVNTP